MPTPPTALTIMFWPESAYGPTNQCLGLAAVLRDRGHTIVFAAERSWAGKLVPFGFVEELVDLAEPEPSSAGEKGQVLPAAAAADRAKHRPDILVEDNVVLFPALVTSGAGYALRYPGDTEDDVRLLTEVLMPELLAARAWQVAG